MIAEPVGLHASLRLDRTSTFTLGFDGYPSMDLTTIDHSKNATMSTKAIYVRDGDRLRYCVAPPSKARPTSFTTTRDNDWTFVTLRRR